jgi:AAA+ superfamily predicted ATPase
MTAPVQDSTWVDANQRLLVAEFARLKRRIGADADEASPKDASAETRAALPAPAAIDFLVDSFGLSPFERDVLLLCAGVEMDAEVATLCEAAQGVPRRPYATFGLALAALEEPHWSALAPVRPLRRWRLLETDEGAPLVTSRLRIDERILHFLAGVNALDARLTPLVHACGPILVMAESQEQAASGLLDELERRDWPPPVVQLEGDDASGQEDAAIRVAAELGLRLHTIRAEDIPSGGHELDAFATLWAREALLLPAALLIAAGENSSAGGGAVARLAERAGGLLFIAGRETLQLPRPTVHCAVRKPEAPDRKRLWEMALGPATQRLNGALDGVASQFRFSARTILTTGVGLQTSVTNCDAPEGVLWQACQALSRPRLSDLAQRIEPLATWDDLVLPEPQKATLRQIAAHVKHRLLVYEDWGFAGKSSRGLGITALFAGESGTGKTMAAEVLAGALQLDLYRIDLSSVVSKYIGETEKNLKRVFDAAEDTGVILLFDEADALFGKRSEVRDSHDRYANIEVSYLLQRMEAYRGLAILTTNMRGALDSAFQRRLRFVVQFPFPDAAQREEIWRGIFPASTPLGEVDYRKLAQLHVAGGSIRNIALNAAFLAADTQDVLRMSHLLHAAHTEAAKRERPLSDAETRGWI